MPFRSKAPCSWPGCSVLTKAGRCPKHPFTDERKTATARGYDHKWRKLRNVYIRENPVCEYDDCVCGRGPAELVDHIIPLPHGERLDHANLQSLSRKCHAVKTQQDQIR